MENTTNTTSEKGWATHLEINIHDNSKLVDIWLTRSEQSDQDTQAKLRELTRHYSAQKYTVAVFQSGTLDLAEETSALLRYNRRRSAEQAVQQKKPRKARDCR